MSRLLKPVLSAAIVVAVSVAAHMLETHIYTEEELEGWELHLAFGAVLGFQIAHIEGPRDRGTKWYSWLLDKLFLAVMWAGAGALILVLLEFLFGGFETPSPTKLISGGLGLLAVAAWELSFRLRLNPLAKSGQQELEERMAEARRIAHENVARLSAGGTSDDQSTHQP